MDTVGTYLPIPRRKEDVKVRPIRRNKKKKKKHSVQNSDHGSDQSKLELSLLEQAQKNFNDGRFCHSHLSLPQYKKALNIRESILGKYHSETADCYAALEYAYNCIGDDLKARGAYRTYLRIQLALLIPQIRLQEEQTKGIEEEDEEDNAIIICCGSFTEEHETNDKKNHILNKKEYAKTRGSKGKSTSKKQMHSTEELFQVIDKRRRKQRNSSYSLMSETDLECIRVSLQCEVEGDQCRRKGDWMAAMKNYQTAIDVELSSSILRNKDSNPDLAYLWRKVAFLWFIVKTCPDDANGTIKNHDQSSLANYITSYEKKIDLIPTSTKKQNIVLECSTNSQGDFENTNDANAKGNTEDCERFVETMEKLIRQGDQLYNDFFYEQAILKYQNVAQIRKESRESDQSTITTMTPCSSIDSEDELDKANQILCCSPSNANIPSTTRTRNRGKNEVEYNNNHLSSLDDSSEVFANLTRIKNDPNTGGNNDVMECIWLETLLQKFLPNFFK